MAKSKFTVYSLYAGRVSRIVKKIKFDFDTFETACLLEGLGEEGQQRILESKRYTSKIRNAELHRDRRLQGDQRLVRYKKKEGVINK